MNGNPRMALCRMGARARDEAGQAVIETAVTLPILLMVVLGIAQFGIAFNHYIMLTDAVRVGARQLASGRQTANPCQVAAARIAASAVSLASANIAVTMTVNGTQYTGTPPGSPSCPGSVGTSMVAGGNAIVSATYPCNLIIYGIDFAVGGACTLSAQTQVRVE